MMLCIFCGAAERALSWSEVRCTWPTVRAGDKQGGTIVNVCDRLMGNEVKVALNRGNESLGRVGLPS
jgi:hypothetical protein